MTSESFNYLRDYQIPIPKVDNIKYSSDYSSIDIKMTHSSPISTSGKASSPHLTPIRSAFNTTLEQLVRMANCFIFLLILFHLKINYVIYNKRKIN
jgi:hypothetical protein